MAAATRLGYQANLAARTLASLRSGLIGVVAAVNGDPLLEAIVRVSLAAAETQGYGSLVSTVPASRGRASSTVHAALGRGVEGLLFIGEEPSAAEVETLRARGVPWVAVGDADHGSPPSVALGRAAGAELACRYLLDLGHRWFGVLGVGDTSFVAGVRRALGERADTCWSQASVEEVGRNSLGQAIEELLGRRDPPTAVLCASDVHAFALLRECTRRGITVPRDLSVVGFGDEPFARHTFPALTTVRPSTVETGTHAVAALFAALAGGEAEPYTPRVKLVVRESAGLAPA